MAEAEVSAAGAGLRITLAVSLVPGEVRERTLHLPAGIRVADVLADHVAVGATLYGIWGRVVAPEQLLRDGDRLEMYRPLTVDPKVARRERFARQGARTTGLFARQRPGGKQGY
ncbi:RnfH family protein [Simplicispira psychrophila]|uniref:RnfH family protein n=1 Tax=Simplicispira psychrophila TaxID=80882 RepID=UPI000486AD63|nr:RnfH family protein [Simplicispira psychrophila]